MNTQFTRNQVFGTLKNVFGFNDFRPGQADVVRNILKGRDLFAVMPTGGGKSLCYQLPAVLLNGVTVVVSPLISLMKDQVDAARANGISAVFLNSSLEHNEQRHIEQQIINDKISLLYVAPERFNSGYFSSLLNASNIVLFAIDEAHCVSQWGHDFRPEYLKLSQIISQFPNVPVAAFTATATQRVQKDIIQRLKLRDPVVSRMSFDRPNLFIEVKPKEKIEAQLLATVKANQGESGIIYRTTRKSVEATSQYLNDNGIKALPYHAGLSQEQRQQNQEHFNNDRVDVVVATVAFGMGIDKSNVRYVLHGDLPKNIEGYYQEIGRAGRDGEKATCILFYSRSDISKIKYFLEQMPEGSEKIAQTKSLEIMSRYAATSVCRRKQILQYFNEQYTKDNCENCDVCTGKVKTVDATRQAVLLITTIAETGSRFGTNMIVDVLRGSKNERVLKFGFDKISTYEKGKLYTKPELLHIVDGLIGGGYLEKQGKYMVLQSTVKGELLLDGKATFTTSSISRSTVRKVKSKTKLERSVVSRDKSKQIDYDYDLFEELRAIRLEIAKRTHVPPYIVFNDASLHEMASVKPVTREAFLEITGVGNVKYKKYGEKFIYAIEHYKN